MEGAFSDREIFTRQAGQFSREAFRERMQSIINERKRI
jgi:hypothetical protein